MNQIKVSGITHHLRLLKAYARKVENTGTDTSERRIQESKQIVVTHQPKYMVDQRCR